jgi:triosephosphate isomerase
MKKNLYFSTNLKMYKNIRETVSYLQAPENLTGDINREELELFVIPSYPSLEPAASSITGGSIKLGWSMLLPNCYA